MNKTYDYTYKDKYSSKALYAFNHTTVKPEELLYTFNILSPIGSYKKSETITQTVPHHHDYFEVVYVISGSYIQKIEDTSYCFSKGQCCILNRNVNHSEVFTDDADILYMMLTDEFLSSLYNSSLNSLQKQDETNKADAIMRLIKRNQKCRYYTTKEYISFTPLFDKETEEISSIIANLLNPKVIQTAGSPYYVAGLIIDFFSILETPSKYQKAMYNLVGKKEETLVNNITRLLQETHGVIHHTDLEKELNYNPDYMNRVIKKATGMTLTDYRTLFLLHEAARLLTDTSLTIDSILIRLNISNKSSFYRKFKNYYALSPASYRKINSQKKDSRAP